MKRFRFPPPTAGGEQCADAADSVYRVLLVRHRLTGSYSVVAYSALSAANLPDGRETWLESGLPLHAALQRAEEWVDGLGSGRTVLLAMDG